MLGAATSSFPPLHAACQRPSHATSPFSLRDACRWNEHTNRAFLLSLGFSLVVADALKVLALTFVSASLLPGFLSPRARVLRLALRSLSKVIDALGT